MAEHQHKEGHIATNNTGTRSNQTQRDCSWRFNELQNSYLRMSDLPRIKHQLVARSQVPQESEAVVHPDVFVRSGSVQALEVLKLQCGSVSMYLPPLLPNLGPATETDWRSETEASGQTMSEPVSYDSVQLA